MSQVSQQRNLIPVILFFCAFSIGAYLVNQNQKLYQKERNLVAQQLLLTHASEIERTLSHVFSSTYSLELELIRSGGVFDNFDQYASRILQHMPGVTNLQLAPDAIVTQIFPLRGNENDIGYNLLIDSDGNEIIREIIRTKALSLDGPISLTRGGVAFIGRNPVYISNGDRSEFWGFTSALITLDDLMRQSGLGSTAEQGFYYELGVGQLNGRPEQIFIHSGSQRPTDVQTTEIAVPGGSWVIRVGNMKGMNPLNWIIGMIVSFLFALMLSVLSRKLLTEPEKLRKKVASQTFELQALAYQDSLTLLVNRLGFNEALVRETEKAKRNNCALTLISIDLDDFKLVNDTMGHPTGDKLLIAVANRIWRIAPASAIVARLGGDEFTIIIVDHENDHFARSIVGSLIREFKQSFSIDANKIKVSISIGMASLNDKINNSEDLLSAADYALYRTKNSNSRGYSVYTETMQLTADRQLQLTSDLRKAVSDNQLELLYQPIVCTRLGEVRKAEALLRWHHPSLGTISPLEFIPLAEQTGLIVEIGDWVFHTAAVQARYWCNRFSDNFQISINVSPIQFNTSGTIQRWLDSLNETGIDGRSILIEITEGILLDNSKNTQEQLGSLKQAGIELALDDFGTGYSSLSYLKNFNIDYVKIDRSFVRNVTKNRNDLILCDGIISIATQLGLRVVAEGIETRAQQELMIDKGCHYSQGYLYSKPIDCKAFEAKYLNSPAESKVRDQVSVA